MDHILACPPPVDSFQACLRRLCLPFSAVGPEMCIRDRVMDVRIGDFVRAGEPICHIHANAAARADAAAKRMQEIVLLSDEEPVRPPLIYATVTPEGVV